MKWSNRHDKEQPPRAALIGSVTVHGVLLALMVLLSLSSPPDIQWETFEVEFVSLAPTEVAEVDAPAVQPEELEIDTPDPEPIEEPPPLPDPDATPVETEPPPDSVQPQPEEKPEEEVTTPTDSTVTEPTPATRTDSTETETQEDGEDIVVRMEGLRRDFPQYYGNIIRQIERCFRPPNTGRRDLETVLYFVIQADGMVSEVPRYVQRSGVPAYDAQARASIMDCAGKGRFGPLPEDLRYERLPIQFKFTSGGDPPPTTGDAA